MLGSSQHSLAVVNFLLAHSDFKGPESWSPEAVIAFSPVDVRDKRGTRVVLGGHGKMHSLTPGDSEDVRGGRQAVIASIHPCSRLHIRWESPCPLSISLNEVHTA